MQLIVQPYSLCYSAVKLWRCFRIALCEKLGWCMWNSVSLIYVVGNGVNVKYKMKHQTPGSEFCSLCILAMGGML